jgi:putative acetyltransferase
MNSEVVAVCALIVSGARHYELAKMATRKDLRGSGIGRRLMLATLERARALGAQKVSLLTHHSLAPALGLYRSVGFVDVPVPPGNQYERADVAMEMRIE